MAIADINETTTEPYMKDETSISTRAKETKSKPWTGKMGKKKENIKLSDLEPSKDAKGGRGHNEREQHASEIRNGPLGPLEKQQQEIGKVPTEETGDQTEKQDLEFLKLAVSSNEGE